MIEPRGRWKRFLSVDEKINKLKEWQIIYPKAEKNIKYTIKVHIVKKQWNVMLLDMSMIMKLL